MGHGHQADLWKGLRMNELAVVSTDHCPFCMKDQKELGIGDFAAIPNGIGGVEHRMELIYQGVVAGELSLRALGGDVLHDAGADVRHVPEEGGHRPGQRRRHRRLGPERRRPRSAINDKHHMNMDYSAWEGWVIDGKVDTVLSPRHVVIENDQYIGAKGHGQFVKPRAVASISYEPVRGGPLGVVLVARASP